MRTDTLFLADSKLAEHFNFSKKSDPFLVTAASLHETPVVGGGAAAIKKARANAEKKVIVPLANSLMKKIRA